jgi:hypothetical protein
VDGLCVPARADHTTLGTLAWISTGRVRAGVDSLHLRGRWACDSESDAGWDGVKAGARARHRAGDGSHYPPPVPVGGSALGAGPPHRQRRSRIPDSGYGLVEFVDRIENVIWQRTRHALFFNVLHVLHRSLAEIGGH